jgi:hypothetical protein
MKTISGGMVLVLVLATTAFPAPATAAELVYELHSCTQRCGLTSGTTDSVSSMALSEYEAKDSLSDQCRWREMSLQGEPSCGHTHFDYSKDEKSARCERGLDTTASSCRATFYGYGKSADAPASVVMVSSDENAATFDQAIAKAETACRRQFLAAGISLYRCDLHWYAPN